MRQHERRESSLVFVKINIFLRVELLARGITMLEEKIECSKNEFQIRAPNR